MYFLDSLNTYSSLIIAIATLVLAIITGIYAFLTWGILSVNRSIIKRLIEPKMVVFDKPMEAAFGCLKFAIKNIGGGPAFDIKLTIFPDIECTATAHKLLSKSSLFVKGLKFLPPGEERSIYLTSGDAIEKDIKEKGGFHEGEVIYKNIANKEHKDKYYIDFNYIKDLYRTKVVDHRKK